MIEFNAISHYDLPTHGHMICVLSDRDYVRDHPDHLLGQNVCIDGVHYEVIGIESNAMPTIQRGTKIGLLVKPSTV